MHFDLTDDQKAIGEALAKLLGDHLPQDRLVGRFDEGGLDAVLWPRLNEMGLGAVMVPAEAGGLELGLLTLAVIADALGAHGAAVPVVNNALAAWLVAAFGTPTQRDGWLEPLQSGTMIAAFALAEPEGGWRPEEWRSAGPRVTARKSHVEWGMEADLFLIGLAGGGLGLVDGRDPAVSRNPVSSLDRMRPLADIDFADAVADPLGSDAEPAALLHDALLVLLAADAYGAAGRALDMAVSYAKERTQFDRLIGTFQGLKHQMANAAAELHPCRPLIWYAAHAWDEIPQRRCYMAALTKAHVTEIAVRTARLSVEMHGGIGYTWEYPLHVFLKRTMVDRQMMGLPAALRARAAALAGW
ncbi:acyl-CoA dehydrogenase family protein [Sphingobium sp. TKS]|uniref:acyl-CoA dehydrogenase family protein n=1 Tax=Sphingobium sp. TKS TaxID=1315974 RepID=UPI00076FF03A|nr:acyl-CoA dehydrogenase family protein [Sphingobium sp. TKS]AMK25617.1 acyl-CoA dehydrogenase [Sphingobium sp. TKS]